MARHMQLEANVSFRDKWQKQPPSIAFVLKNRKKRGYAVAIPNTIPNSKVVEGAHFFYQKEGSIHRIWAIGPVLAELLIMASQFNSPVGAESSFSACRLFPQQNRP